MHSEYIMGNEAMGLAALAAGVTLVCGYPGTPSTEVLESVVKNKKDLPVHVEWSVNEKAALELGAGAAYAGGRVLVTMKQVGLNVASDPLMSLAYIGIKGGMVILVADDPGPISSQTEQDTRRFAEFAKLPVFDPSTVSEAYDMMQEAFDFSETYATPVLFRPTTRISHGYASLAIKDPAEYRQITPEGFIRDASRWVIFPRLSYQNHLKIEDRNDSLQAILSEYSRNAVIPAKVPTRRGIASQGISFAYLSDMNVSDETLLKIATPFPFPERLALDFLSDLDEVLCLEELDPVIEDALLKIAGKYHLPVTIRGKHTHDAPRAGENTPDNIAAALASFRGEPLPEKTPDDRPSLPVRPPVLCAGCPHRASFLAVKDAMAGEKAVFCGDIGCYTLGNAQPLDMVDTCLCMGAGVNIAQGISRTDPGTRTFAFVGDSTFFASAITGAVNAVYSGANMTLVVLDNSTTAMTGHQPHPGTGFSVTGEVASKISIEAVLTSLGLKAVEVCDPLDYQNAVKTVKRLAALPGTKAVIFRSPCVALLKGLKPTSVDPGKCIGCRKCINKLGCPGLLFKDKKAAIDPGLCTGCGLCSQLCPVGAIGGKIE